MELCAGGRTGGRGVQDRGCVQRSRLHAHLDVNSGLMSRATPRQERVGGMFQCKLLPTRETYCPCTETETPPHEPLARMIYSVCLFFLFPMPECFALHRSCVLRHARPVSRDHFSDRRVRPPRVFFLFCFFFHSRYPPGRFI